MLSILRRLVLKNFSNIPGWHSNRKIVLIESDDWGSIRMPSRYAFEALLKKGIRVDACHYCSNDTLESEEDLTKLFDILSSVVDIHGNPAIITANTVVANPDFEKIKESDFKEYHYELITDTYQKVKGCAKSIDLLKKGVEERFLSIQSHGREHLNIKRWMHYLQNANSETRYAFELGVYGISTTVTTEKRKTFLAAFDFENPKDEKQVIEIAKDGLRIFIKLFGFRSESLIAPNYVWSRDLEKGIAEEGVDYIQGTRFHSFKLPNGRKTPERVRFFGKKNEFGQIDLVRNVFFEPSENPQKDWLGSCLREIESAFFWKHPAVICSHRVNYVGGLNKKQRDQNLLLLNNLLREIKKKWPNVEFMSSNQLGNIIREDQNV